MSIIFYRKLYYYVLRRCIITELFCLHESKYMLLINRSLLLSMLEVFKLIIEMKSLNFYNCLVVEFEPSNIHVEVGNFLTFISEKPLAIIVSLTQGVRDTRE